MSDKHPYMSGSAGLMQAVNHLRRSFPAQVTAETLKKLGIAPNNETYVINILRFINVLDEAGNKTAQAASVFAKHDTTEFQKAFTEMIAAAYSGLYELHGAETWNLATDKLISYFRETDHTSSLVGQRQAGTFQALAALSGHGEIPATKIGTPARTERKQSQSVIPRVSNRVSSAKKDDGDTKALSSNVGLTVRIEVNLPVSGDQETYDRIFKSIRENLLNAK
jgi:uncharacterized protein DUF5343